MTLRLSLLTIATLLFLTALMALSEPARAHTGPLAEEGFAASWIMASGPLNVVVFRISGR